MSGFCKLCWHQPEVNGFRIIAQLKSGLEENGEISPPVSGQNFRCQKYTRIMLSYDLLQLLTEWHGPSSSQAAPSPQRSKFHTQCHSSKLVVLIIPTSPFVSQALGVGAAFRNCTSVKIWYSLFVFSYLANNSLY